MSVAHLYTVCGHMRASANPRTRAKATAWVESTPRWLGIGNGYVDGKG